MPTKREPLDVFLLWLWIGSLTVLALCVLTLSPALYILLVSASAGVGSIALAVAMVHDATSDGSLIGVWFAGEVIRGTFQLLGAILSGLADATK